jgi:hypothetical protein
VACGAQVPETGALELLFSLASALVPAKGYSATEVNETRARARSLAEQLNRPEYIVPLMASQAAFHFLRAEHRLTRSDEQAADYVSSAVCRASLTNLRTASINRRRSSE